MNLEKIEEWILDYEAKLTEAYSDDSWKYFDHERLRVCTAWNGYICDKCGSRCAVRNSDGWCIKCLVLREKIDVLHKMLKQLKELKGGQ
jgi:hypothetical protein